MATIEELATPGVRQITPYQPGRPAEEVAAEFGIERPIKLASNENPLGPSPLALVAMQQVGNLARYPDGNGMALKTRLAQRHDVEVSCVTLGNGSNDILEFVTRAFVNPGNEVIFSQHAFAVYPLATLAVGGTPVVTPAKDWGNDLDAMLAAITDRTRVIFIANPNNPTGTWVGRQALETFLDAVPEHVITVIDEAYAEYVEQPEYPDCTQWIDRYDRLLVTRTFSKIYGLAGLRIGYGLSSPALADFLNRVRQPFNCNSLALVAAEAALKDNTHVETSRRVNREGMALIEEACHQRNLGFIPSVGNFITIDFGRPADDLFQAMMRHGIIVRPVANYGLPNHLRVTIGSAGENARFLHVLDQVLNHG
jgi:histidinol-phosphate aminotransferase